jgi:hypothetical protein
VCEKYFRCAMSVLCFCAAVVSRSSTCNASHLAPCRTWFTIATTCAAWLALGEPGAGGGALLGFTGGGGAGCCEAGGCRDEDALEDAELVDDEAEDEPDELDDVADADPDRAVAEAEALSEPVCLTALPGPL